MLGKLILAEERTSGKLSSLRIFTRLDISVYRDVSRDGSGFQYVLSEVNRNLSTCLYFNWAKPSGMRDAMLLHHSKLLWHVARYKCLLKEPPL